MARKAFYEIKPAAYLFQGQVLRQDSRKQPEESVRQWCIHELIRAYGVMISEIEVERPVRVGSKKYKIDILILHRGVPWAVVECKELAHSKPDEGMEQAVSYANAQEIQAEFAVYTNGKSWNVRRRLRDKWIAVPDLPRNFSDGTLPISELLRAIHDVAPLLCKLDEKIEGAEAEKFLKAMQRFFSGSNLLTEEVSNQLLVGTDNLLRMLSSDSGDFHYQFGKFRVAVDFFERYRQLKGFPLEIGPVSETDSFSSEIQCLHSGIMNMAEGTTGISSPDALVVRLIAALLDYGRLQYRPRKSFPEVPPHLHRALRDYLNYAFNIGLNVALPDPIDQGWASDMKSYCSFAWRECV